MPGAIGGAARSPAGGRRRLNWRVPVVRGLANALALVLVVAVLPGVRVDHAHPLLAFVVLGATFGALNAFVKPAIQFVALPLLFGSFGLVLVLVDALVLWLLDLVLPQLFSVDGVGSLFAAAALLGVLSFVLDGVLGLTPPIVDDVQHGRTRSG
jgi:putative membrane protein